MENIKQYLYDTIVEEFNKKPSFLLARTLYLFCHYNVAFDMPRNIERTFLQGLLEDEVRAFSLRYPIKRTNGDGKGKSMNSGAVYHDSMKQELEEMKRDIFKEIAAENLSKGTGKTYSPSMVEKFDTKYKSVLSYNEILEIFILSGS